MNVVAVLTPCDGYVIQPQSPDMVEVSRRFTATDRSTHLHMEVNQGSSSCTDSGSIEGIESAVYLYYSSFLSSDKSITLLIDSVELYFKMLCALRTLIPTAIDLIFNNY